MYFSHTERSESLDFLGVSSDEARSCVNLPSSFCGVPRVLILSSAGDSKKTLGGKLELPERRVEESELCKLLCEREVLTAAEGHGD